MIGPKRFADRWQEEKFGTKEPEKPKPVEEPPPAKKRYTADELEGFLHELAADPDSGADRMRAIKMLRNQGEAEDVKLLEDDEVLPLMVIEMKALGATAVQTCYRRAFPTNKKLETAEIKLDESLLSKEAMKRVMKVRGLRSLYRVYPEIKQSGWPSGFPVGRSPETKQIWAQKTAMKIEIDREQAVLGPPGMVDVREEGLESQPDAVGQPPS